MAFEELRIRLIPIGPERYLVLANGLHSAAAVISFPNPHRFVEGRNAVLRDDLAGGARQAGGGRTPGHRLADLGEELFQQLFPPPIRECLERYLQPPQGPAVVDHLRLRFSLPGELQSLPAEILRIPPPSPHGTLAVQAVVPPVSVVRPLTGQGNPHPRELAATDRGQHVRLLIVVAAPENWPLPQAADEINEILAQLATTGAFVEVEILAGSQALVDLVPGQNPQPVTRTNLDARVGALSRPLTIPGADPRPAPPAVILVIAHGDFDPKQKRGVVLLEDDNGAAHPVPGQPDFAGILANAPTVRLVMLNLCRGAQAGPDGQLRRDSDPFVGVAQALIGAGIPAVVGMDYSIGDVAASKFSPALLAALVTNTPLDLAIRQGRALLTNVAERTARGAPVPTNTQWCIPASLVHEQSHCPLLFHVILPHLGDPPPNPLAAGAAAVLHALHAGQVAHALLAIGYCRLKGDWHHAVTIANMAIAAGDPNGDLPRLRDEAQLELRLPLILSMCKTLANLHVWENFSDWNKVGPAWDKVRHDAHTCRATWNHLHPTLRAGCLKVLGTMIQALESMISIRDEAEQDEKRGAGQNAREKFQAVKNLFPVFGFARFLDIDVRLHYTSGQVAAWNNLWQEAFREFDQMPPQHPDREPHRCRAGGFAAMEREGWKDAVKFLQPLMGFAPDEATASDPVAVVRQVLRSSPPSDIPHVPSFSNVPLMLAYAWARLTESKAALPPENERNWKEAAEVYRLLLGEDFPDVKVRECYCEARGDEVGERWGGAAEWYDKLVKLNAAIFGESGDQLYPDVIARAAYCRGRLAEAARKWGEALGWYRKASSILHQDRDVRLNRCEIWLGVGGSLQACDWGGAVRGIDDLTELKRDDTSNLKRWRRWCRNEAKELWSTLTCMSEQRCTLTLENIGDNYDPQLTEFLSFPVADRTRPANLLVQFGKVVEEEEPPSPEAVAGKLGDDKGIFFFLYRMHREAVEFFHQSARQRPDDVTRLHRLGLAALAKINLARMAQEHPDVEDWLTLIAAWGAVFADDTFWRKDASANGRTAAAHARLEAFWTDHFAANSDGQLRLDVLFRAELAGARAVQSAGGSPVVGRLGVKALGLGDAVARWVASLPPSDAKERLVLYLSELAEAAVLFEWGQDAEVVAALTPTRCESPSTEAARRRMLEASHGRLATACLGRSPADLSGAFAHWVQAVELARQGGDASARLSAVRQEALTHARQVCGQEGERRLEALNGAVEFLRRLGDVGWDTPDGEIRDALVEALLDRAFFYSHTLENDRAARLDAQEAHTLAPWSLRAVRALCWSSLFLARQLHGEGNLRAARHLAGEIETSLARGEALNPADEELAECRRHAEGFAELLGEGRSGGLGRVLDEISDPDLDPESRQVARMIERASNLEADRKYREAIEAYQEVLAADPDCQEAARRLPWCYHWWIKHEIEHGTPRGLHEAIRAAHRNFPEAEMLAEFYKDFPSLLR